jgi:Ca2+-binding RTX toxin-like protein/subtilisin-like proprotein convertase family protein
MPFIPNDPLYAAQWHFATLGMRGANRGIEVIWDDYRGAGIWVGVYDTGVDRTHPDLAGNLDGTRDIIVNNAPHLGAVPNPAIISATLSDPHGTAVAGIIAAVGNNGLGGTGIAFDASLSSITFNASSGNVAFQQLTNFDVVNCSFGGGVYGAWSFDPNYQTAAERGRAGLGTVVVKSAGNSDVITDTESTDTVRFNLNVAAGLQTGFIAAYSNYGPSVLVTAPGSPSPGTIVTTDIQDSQGYNTNSTAAGGDYGNTFNGTSAAAPMVSGIVALMLDANPHLGWRDVQEILALSAVQTGSAMFAGPSGNENFTWGLNGANTWNGGGMHVSNDYGYGMANVFNAVRLAEAWAYIGKAAETSGSEIKATGAVVNDTTPLAGVIQIPVAVATQVEIDHVSVTVTFTDANLLNFRLALISAEGTTIVLHDGRTGTLNAANTTAYQNGATGGLTWTFGVEALRGEDSFGTWQLQVTDPDFALGRAVTNVTIDAYGGYWHSDNVYTYTDELALMLALPGQAGRNLMNDGAGENWFNGATLTGNLQLNMNPGTNSTLNGAAFISTSATNRLIGAIGTDFQDVMQGNGLDNRIYGMREDDTITGGNGDDLINGGKGGDALSGDGGIDTVDYEGSTAAVIIDLSAPAIADRARGGDAEGDELLVSVPSGDNTFENVNGSEHDDRLTGDYRANVLSGGEGDDLLNGLGDADRLNGARGGDFLIGGIGGDNVSGGEGGDTIFGDQLLLFASATSTNHIFSFDETGNISLQRALNLRGLFAITPDANVTNAATVPHVTVTGEGSDAVAYFSFFAFAGESASFDIDATSAGFDSWIKLYDATGVEIAQNDDAAIDAGSTVGTDSFLSFNFTSNQLYTIAVGRYVAGVFSPIANNAGYTLHISLTNPSTTVQGGDDTLFGDMGSDGIDGGTGDDTIFGDQNLINPSPGQVSKPAGLGNGSIDRALNIDGTFSLAANANIENATTVNHVTVAGTGDGAIDYYAFTVTAASTSLSTFDIDGATFDASLRLYNADGVVLAENDDNNLNGNATPDPGSGTLLDSMLRYSFAAPGLYYIAVSALTGAGRFSPIAASNTYTLHLSVENATLTPSGGNDTLWGGPGNDTERGGAGNDELRGGTGDDTLDGGAGIDTADYSDAAAGGVTVNLALGGAQFVGGGRGSDTLSGIENLIGSDFNDTLAGNGAANLIDGRLGEDAMAGGGGSDTFIVDSLLDTVSEGLNAGNDAIRTAINNYSLVAIANVEQLIFTGSGNFVGRGNGTDNRILGGFGNDRFVADAGGADRYFGDFGSVDQMDFRPSVSGAIVNLTTGVHGGAAAGDFFSSIEYFYGSNTAGDDFTGAGFNDRFDGYGGGDTLSGLGGNDTINGGDGDDEISGGALLDFLNGNAGADDFNYADASDSGPTSGARDRIFGFEAGIDDIDVSAIDASAAGAGDDAFIQFIGSAAFTAEGQVRWYQSGANTVIEFNTTGTGGAEMQIQLQNFTAASLAAADFIA